MRKISQIIIHCSDTADSLDIGAKEIRRYHVEDRGWSDIGYHHVIRRSGKIEAGRDERTPGAHVRGHNKRSIGVCWVGRDYLEPAQEEALYELLKDLLFKYYLSPENVLGHYEFNSGKTCPNLYMNEVRIELARRLMLDLEGP